MEAKATIIRNRGAAAAVKLTRPKPISKAWGGFAQKLAAVLAGLVEDQYLVISKKDSNLFVQFLSQGEWGMRVETTSNSYRDKKHQLTEAQMARLAAMGWTLPTGNSKESTPEADPDGSPNIYIDIPQPVDFDHIARLAIDTFVQIVEASHPAMCEYEAFDGQGNSVPFPMLPLKRRINSGEEISKDVLQKKLLDTVTELTNIHDLSYDEDGDICLNYGCAAIFVSLQDQRPFVRMYSKLLRKVEPTLALLTRINEINSENGHMHLIANRGAVIAMSEILVAPFVASHVAHALGNFSQIADSLKEKLQLEFDDEAAVSEQNISPVRH